jgi:hypothetical protein
MNKKNLLLNVTRPTRGASVSRVRDGSVRNERIDKVWNFSLVQEEADRQQCAAFAKFQSRKESVVEDRSRAGSQQLIESGWGRFEFASRHADSNYARVSLALGRRLKTTAAAAPADTTKTTTASNRWQ